MNIMIHLKSRMNSGRQLIIRVSESIQNIPFMFGSGVHILENAVLAAVIQAIIMV